MAQSRHRIELTGDFAPGSDWKASLESLAALMKLPLPKLRVLLANAPVVIKRDVDAETAERYRDRIEQTGLLCRIVPPIGSGEAVRAQPPVTAADETASGQTQEAGPSAMATGAAPTVSETAGKEHGASIPSEFAQTRAEVQPSDRRKTPAASARVATLDPGQETIEVDRTFSGRGFGWVAEGWQLFAKSPGVWIAITFVYAVAVIGINIVPLVGVLGYYLLQPVLLGGVMLGCFALERGESLEMSHLFQGFDTHLNELLKLGGICLGGMFISMFVTFSVVFATAGTSMLFSEFSGEGMANGDLPTGALIGIVVAILTGTSLSIVVIAMLWFSPALIVLRGVGAWDAAKLSLAGVLRNFLPLTLYSIALLALAVLASIPLFLGWLILGPIFVGSIFAGYRDIYPDFREVTETP